MSSDEEEWDEIPNEIPNSSNEIEIHLDSIERPKKKRKISETSSVLLVCLLASCLFRNRICDQLQGKMLSVLPLNLLNEAALNTCPETVKSVMEWYLISTSTIHLSADYSLIKSLERDNLLQGQSKELHTLLFVALLRSLSLRSRLVASLDLNLSPCSKTKKIADPFPIAFAVQVFDAQTQSWIDIDLLNKSMGDQTRFGERDVYIISLESLLQTDGTSRTVIKDVTAHFSKSYSVVTKKRLKDWDNLIWMFSANECNELDEKENAEMLAKRANEAMPTTISGFQNHPLFALERHLGVNQAIYPLDKKEIIATFKEYAVYPRKNVHTLYTRGKFLTLIYRKLEKTGSLD